MTIRSNGGVFGRNPEFQTATIKGDLTLTTALQFVGGARLSSTGTTLIIDKNLSINTLALGRAAASTSETNTVFGFAALQNASYSGTDGTAIGWGAMFSATGNAYQNTAIGRGALFATTSGWVNTAVGASAGAGNTSGKNNTFIGGGSGGITTGSNNIVIGHNAAASAGTVSNETTIGNSSTTKTRIFGDIVLASGNGIDFSATDGTGTSELFSDYEEGTFTPNQGVGLTVVGAFSSEGRYTKIGRTITIQGYVAGATSIAVSTNGQMFTNAPFVAALTTAGSAAGYTVGNSACLIINGTSTVSSNTAIGASSAILFTMTYSV